MILVFDLDDTLYPELDYVKSGIFCVAKYLYDVYNLNIQTINSEMFIDLKENGRGLVFNNTLKKYKIFSNKNLKKCISIYRNHNPKISLYNEVEKFLEISTNFNLFDCCVLIQIIGDTKIAKSLAVLFTSA
jgi:putative hydrolase of the HAD superfamily